MLTADVDVGIEVLAVGRTISLLDMVAFVGWVLLLPAEVDVGIWLVAVPLFTGIEV